MIRIGTDPEVFLRDELGFVSAHGLFPGTKKVPYPVDKGAIQVDGMALEFNIHPAETEDEFNRNIETVLQQMREMVLDVGGGHLEMVFEPVADFDPEYFALQPYDSKILGCDPDYDGLGREKTPPEDLEFSPFRTAAGHVHIGWTEGVKDVFDAKHFAECQRVAQAFVKVPGFHPVTKLEKRRNKFYGAPPSFRPKSYGAELRSPSNRWVKYEKTRRGMFNNVKKRMAELGKE